MTSQNWRQRKKYVMVWHPRYQHDGPSLPLLSLEQWQCGQTGREPQTVPQLPPCSSSSFCGAMSGRQTGKLGGALEEEERGTAAVAQEAGPTGRAERQHLSGWTVTSGGSGQSWDHSREQGRESKPV